MPNEIKIEGLAEVLNKIKSVEDAKGAQDGIKKACALLERAAKEKTPKDTGELRRSITSQVEGLEGKVFTPLLYAPYIEFGTGLYAEEGGREDVPWHYQDDEGVWHSTSGMEPQPFMRPALDENREEVFRIIREAILNHD